MTQQVKNPSAAQETQEMWVRSLGREDPLEEGMAAHSSIFAWETPRTEEPGGLQSMGSPQSDMAECMALTHKGSSGRSQKTIHFKVVLHNPPSRRKKGKKGGRGGGRNLQGYLFFSGRHTKAVRQRMVSPAA